MAERVTPSASYREQPGSVWPCKRDPGWGGANGGRKGSPAPCGVGMPGITSWFGGCGHLASLPAWGFSALGAKVHNPTLTPDAEMNSGRAPLFQLFYRQCCGAQEGSPRAWGCEDWPHLPAPCAQCALMRGSPGGQDSDWAVQACGQRGARLGWFCVVLMCHPCSQLHWGRDTSDSAPRRLRTKTLAERASAWAWGEGTVWVSLLRPSGRNSARCEVSCPHRYIFQRMLLPRTDE